MRSALILICALGATCLSCAQSKPKSWTNLNALHEGDKIQILEVDHQAISGSFQNATEDSLSVQNKAGAQTIRKQDIRSVRILKNTHRLRNTLIGSGHRRRRRCRRHRWRLGIQWISRQQRRRCRRRSV